MGVDVASFGDFFAEQRLSRATSSAQTLRVKKPSPATSAPLSHDQQDPNSTRNELPEVVNTSSSAHTNGSAITIKSSSTQSDSIIANSANGSGLGSEADGKVKDGRNDASAPRKRHGQAAAAEGPIETLTYRDPFAGVYKKCVHIRFICILVLNLALVGTSSVRMASIFSVV